MTDCSEERFFFRYLDGKTVTLDVDPHTTISEVKTMLIAKHQQTTSSKPHENTALSAAAPITDLSLVVLTFWFYLWLAALGVPAAGGVRSDDIFLSSNGKPLVDQAKLSDYHYCLGSTIHVAGRVRGGCFMLSATVFAIICCACLSSLCTCGLSLVVVPFLLPLLFILPLFCL